MGDKITVPHILKMKQRGEGITCLTAYDYSFARILAEAGIAGALDRNPCSRFKKIMMS